MLAVLREICECDRFVRSGGKTSGTDFKLATKFSGKRVGIIGLGRIGLAIAKRAKAFEDIVAKIYMQMDLLPFGDEDESPNLLFNSEDNNQSWRDKCDKNEKHNPNSINQSVSTEGNSLQRLANRYNNTKEIGEDEHTRILNEARERRERARRFAPFVGKARDLQRVWAPKQPKAVKCKYDAIPNKSKRKKNRQTLSCSVVCETPMTGNKRTHSRGNNNNEGKSFNDLGNSSCSVAKALFQDN